MIKFGAILSAISMLSACMHDVDSSSPGKSKAGQITQQPAHQTKPSSVPVTSAADLKPNDAYYLQAIEKKNQAVAKSLGIQRLSQATIDLKMGLIFFKVGKDTQAYEIDVIGSYDPSSKSLEWAWENSALDEDLKITAGKLKSYGEKNNIAALKTPSLNCSEQQAWQYTALAAHLTGVDGAYSAEVKGKRVFVVFKTNSD